jgi:hypothetical protein
MRATPPAPSALSDGFVEGKREPSVYLIVEFIARRCLHVGLSSLIATGQAS